MKIKQLFFVPKVIDIGLDLLKLFENEWSQVFEHNAWLHILPLLLDYCLAGQSFMVIDTISNLLKSQCLRIAGERFLLAVITHVIKFVEM